MEAVQREGFCHMCKLRTVYVRQSQESRGVYRRLEGSNGDIRTPGKEINSMKLIIIVLSVMFLTGCQQFWGAVQGGMAGLGRSQVPVASQHCQTSCNVFGNQVYCNQWCY